MSAPYTPNVLAPAEGTRYAHAAESAARLRVLGTLRGLFSSWGYETVDVPVLVGSAANLRRAIGWTPEVPLDRTLDDLLGWWRANAD